MKSIRQYRRSTFRCAECPREGVNLSVRLFATKAAAFQHGEATGHLISETRTEVIQHHSTHKKHPDGDRNKAHK